MNSSFKVNLINFKIKHTQARTLLSIDINNDKINAIIKALKTIGIADKDVKTTNYNLYPKHNWVEGTGDFIDGYTLSQQLELKIRDFDKVAQVLQTATSLGANTIDQVQFSVEDPQKVKGEAMKEAVAKAKEKAQSIADASGLKLGKLVNVSEDTGSIPTPTAYSAPTTNGMGGGDTSVTTPDIQPGQEEVTVSMSLTYRL